MLTKVPLSGSNNQPIFSHTHAQVLLAGTGAMMLIMAVVFMFIARKSGGRRKTAFNLMGALAAAAAVLCLAGGLPTNQ